MNDNKKATDHISEPSATKGFIEGLLSNESSENDFQSNIGRLMSIPDPTIEQTKIIKSLLDGESTFIAMKNAVENLTEFAPKDHDTLITAFGLIVHKVTFQQPHTFTFCGIDETGNHSSVVVHYSQLVVKIVYLPHQEGSPNVVGFHAIGIQV